MSNSPPNPDEIEVEAELLVIQEDGKPALDTIQLQLAEIMTRRGYEPLFTGRRVWEFLFNQSHSPPGFWWRFQEKLGLVNEIDRQADKSIEILRQTRNDKPYRIKFRFIPNSWEGGEEGYLIEIESIPALQEKLDRLQFDVENINPKSAVRTNKSELRDIATEAGFYILTQPFTSAENYSATLNDHLRKQLHEYAYGHQVIHFADEADQALKYSLNRPALSGYFHGIEWAIIAYIEAEENRDIMAKEGYGRGKGFPQLVEDLKDTAQTTQTTVGALESMNQERIWMAHHKSGHVSDIEVRRVKQRFSILLEELYL